jgi:hypothetical protein
MVRTRSTASHFFGWEINGTLWKASLPRKWGTVVALWWRAAGRKRT